MRPQIFIAFIAFFSAITVFGVANGDTVLERVRSELATLLKKDAASLPVDKPVQQIGADELDIVEWVMAVEEAFHVTLPDEKLVDKKTMTARKDLSISVMSQLTKEAIEAKKKRP